MEGILGIENLERAIWNLNKRLGLSKTIKDGLNTVIPEDKFLAVLDRMSERALEDACTLTNPRKPTVEDIKKIYEAAYYGKDVTSKIRITYRVILPNGYVCPYYLVRSIYPAALN